MQGVRRERELDRMHIRPRHARHIDVTRPLGGRGEMAPRRDGTLGWSEGGRPHAHRPGVQHPTRRLRQVAHSRITLRARLSIRKTRRTARAGITARWPHASARLAPAKAAHARTSVAPNREPNPGCQIRCSCVYPTPPACAGALCAAERSNCGPLAEASPTANPNAPSSIRGPIV